jgi:Aspartyl protease
MNSSWASGRLPGYHSSATLSASTKTSLSSPFTVSLSIPDLSISPFTSLLDSGASDNFIDASVVSTHQLVPLDYPIQLRMIDGALTTSGVITHSFSTAVVFPGLVSRQLRFLVTKLHPSVQMVLGLPWLQRENPRINWTTGDMYLTMGAVPVPPDTATPLPFSFLIPLSLPHLQNTSLDALLDSGASDNFIDSSLVSDDDTHELEEPILISRFDGTPTNCQKLNFLFLYFWRFPSIVSCFPQTTRLSAWT